MTEVEALRVLQRVVMPVDRDLDVLKLYVEGPIARGAEAVEAERAAEDDITGTPAEDVGRRSAMVPVGERVSFATYFNAFPASYWRRWTTVEEVVLRVRVRGDANLIVYRSSAKGHVQRVASVRVDSVEPHEETFRLSLEPFIDGGWYWLDVVAGERAAVLERADWCAEATDTTRQGRVSLGITTFNRPAYCVAQLIALAEAPEVLEVVDAVYVVDQGTERVRDHGDFPLAAEALGARLRVIEQPNLGGSGGFARAMDETLRAGTSDYVLLLDDDVVTETEGVLRAVAFGDHARTPTIVGGHMFNLFLRSQLHAYGETIQRYRWWWDAAPKTRREHDFARPAKALAESLPEDHPLAAKQPSTGSLRETKWLHRRVDVDYNGWWMCLIPVDVMRKVGLSMPMFIKWDDAEYCVRAGAAGFPTVSLPGMAAWHVPWQDKDDGIDWQAYFHERNRLVTALLHSPYERGGNLVKESFIVSVKHALSMQYSAAELMLWAITDVLRGPDHMHAEISGKLAEIRAFRAAFPDARNRPSHEEFPQVKRRKPAKRGRDPKPPKGRAALLAGAALGAIRQLRPVDELARGNPQAAVPHIDRHWGVLSQFDSALVSSADGTKVAWYQRDPERFKQIMKRTSLLHARLSREWPELSRRYRAAMDELAAPETWRRTFESSQR